MKSHYLKESAGVTAAAYGTGVLFLLGIMWGQGEIVNHNYGIDEAQSYLEQNGYTDVEQTDTDTFAVGMRGCDRTDAVKYEFIATAPNGAEHIGAAVCKGLFKGATIRQN